MTSKVKILVVEDDLHVAAVLETRLKSFGYDVCGIARSGPVAVRESLAQRPDLVLMDILLEGDMNGIEAAESISDQMDVPIIFITCLNDQRLFDRAVGANAYGYIVKPYNHVELRHTIQIALIKHDAAKERDNLIEALNRNINERRQMEEKLRQLNETLEEQVAERTALADARAGQMQALAAELIETEERERRQFAHLLHDDLQQMLAAARMQLQAVAEDFPNEPSLADVAYILGQSIEKARTLSNEISPPVLHHTGLIGALEWLVQRMGEQFDLVVELNTDVERQHEYTPLKTFLFRTVQELLFNVVKHSGVKRARIEVCGSDSQVSVSVCDGGRGFLPDIIGQSKAGFGLMSIRERAGYIGGSLTIDSAPGRGSRFTLTVPLGPLKNRDTERQLPGR